MTGIKNSIYCPARLHWRHSVLCPRCGIYQETGCRSFYENENILRRQRHVIEISRIGRQRRILPERVMIPENGEQVAVDYE